MFHKNLRNAREGSNISQKQMADMLGIPVTTYRNYENTLREPSYEILVKICEILSLSADELLGIENKDLKLIKLFSKIKHMNENKLQMLNLFVDFLNSTK